MANSASISATIAGRYAQAVFDIAQQEGRVDALSDELAQLDQALHDSEDLRDMVESPVLSRDVQETAISAVGQRMGLGDTLLNTLRLMARNRRLFALPYFVTALRHMVDEARGETTAEVVSATEMSQEQQDRLRQILSAKSGKTVRLDTQVDESLIGGMIVKLGSQMIDSSIRSQLSSLQTTMKEVG